MDKIANGKCALILRYFVYFFFSKERVYKKAYVYICSKMSFPPLLHK
jgi:hypothetical protein